MSRENLLVPEGTRRILRHQFKNLELEEIVLPEGLERIGAHCFRNSKLRRLVLPSTVTHIDFGAFSACDNLEEVILPEGVRKIGPLAFSECENLKIVRNMPKSGIVKRGVKAKFKQNKDILEKLLGTGNELLAECSPYDKKWGIGIDIDDPDRLVMQKWKGQNFLGRILMEVREELREEVLLSSDSQLKHIEAKSLEPIVEWNMTAGELQRISQYHNAIQAFCDTLQDQYIRDSFLYGYSLQDWDIAMKVNMGGGLTIIGFYEMKQEVYDIARRLTLHKQKTDA